MNGRNPFFTTLMSGGFVLKTEERLRKHGLTKK